MYCQRCFRRKVKWTGITFENLCLNMVQFFSVSTISFATLPALPVRNVRFIWNSWDFKEEWISWSPHLSRDWATYLKVHIYISLCRDVLEVDGCVVLVLRFAQIEGKLIVDGEVIIATLVHRISEIMVLGVTFLTVVACNSLGCAKTIPSPAIIKNEQIWWWKRRWTKGVDGG